MILGDSNVLLRLLQRHHPQHAAALNAIRQLRLQDELVIAPQNVVELWVVATRPLEQNGLGMKPSRAATYLSRLNRTFTVLQETAELQQEWERLVVAHQVSGKKAHDTRLVAIMNVHGVRGILTFNVDDFRRYPGIRVMHPSSL